MSRPAVLALKINLLFDVLHKRAEAPLTTEAAADAIAAQSGVPISAADLNALRSGANTDPNNEQLGAIAEFFGVPKDYLLAAGPVPDIDAQLNLLRDLRDAGIRAVDLGPRADQ
jgi:transcriptional regulator with XRE-family HTH domain